MRRVLATVGLLAVAVGPIAAQQPFDQLPEQATVVDTQELLVYDETQTDPFEQQRRLTIGTLLASSVGDGVASGLTFADRTGTLTRTAGLSSVTVQLDADAYDDRISTWARVVSPSGVAPAVRVGSGAGAGRVLYTGNGTLSEWVTLSSIGGGLARADVTVGNGLAKTDLTGQAFRLDLDFDFGTAVTAFSISDRLIVGDSTGGVITPAQASFGFLRRYFGDEFRDEGTRLGTEDPATIIDLTGAGITGTRSGTTITLNVPLGLASIEGFAQVGTSDTIPASRLGTSVGPHEFLFTNINNAPRWQTFIGASSGSSTPGIFINSSTGNIQRQDTVPTAFLPAANALDSELPSTGELVPSGGADGQILAKASDTDGDTEWINAPAGGGGSNDGVANAVTLAYSGSTLTTTIGLSVGSDLSDTVTIPNGDVTGVTAGTGLTGGGTSGTVTLGIAASGVGTAQLADNAITSPKIQAGAITLSKLNTALATDGDVIVYRPAGWTFEAQSGGGGGGSDDGVADSFTLGVSGTTLTGTIGRSGTLADLSDTATLPTDGVANALDLSLTGNDLTATVGRSGTLADLTDTITLPAGAGAVTFTRVGVGTVDLTDSIAVPQSFDLSDPIEDGELIEFRVTSGTGVSRIVLGHFLITGQEVLALPAQGTGASNRPTTLAGALVIKTGIQGNTQITAFGHSSLYIWRADTDTLWARNPRANPVTVDVSELQLTGGGGGGGGSDGVADTLTTALSARTVTTTIGRSGTLADLSDTFTIPDDDVVDAAAFAARTLTLGRAVGADIPAIIPATAFDDRIEDWAEEGDTELLPTAKLGTSSTAFDFLTISNGNTGTWRTLVGARTGVSGDQAMFVQSGVVATAADLPDGYIPDAIARDTELPSAGELVPTGGDDGQILAKDSDTDGDTVWIDAPSGGGGGGAFDLHDDVADEQTVFQQTDRLLVSAEEVSGDPNRWASFDTLETTIRPRASDENTLLTEEAAGFNCLGGGITCTVNQNNSVAVTVPTDDVVDGGSITGTTLTLTLAVGSDITIPGLPSGGGGGGGGSTDMVLQWSAQTATGANLAVVNTTVATGLQPPTDADIIALRARINGSHNSADNHWTQWYLLDAATYRGLTVVSGTGTAPADGGAFAFDSGGPPVDQKIFPITSGGDEQVGWRGSTVAGPSIVQMRTAEWVEVGGGGGGADDGVADSLSTDLSGTTITTTIGRTGTLGDLTDTVTLPAISALSGTLLSTQLADNTVHGGRLFDGTIGTAKYGDGTVTNAKIVSMAASKLTGTIADARIPAGIARDSELPTLPSAVTQAEAEAGTVTATRLWSPQRVSQAIASLAGSGGGDVTGIDAGHAIRIDDGSTATPEVNFDPSVGVTQHTTNFNANDRIYLTAFGVNGTLRYAPYSQFSTDSRNQIATWARSSNPTGSAPIARGGTGATTAATARTALGLNNAFVSADINGQVITFTEADGGTDTVTVPSGGGGSNDGVADSVALSASARTLTVTVGRSVGVDLSDSATLAANAFDDRINTWARANNPTGSVPIARGGTGATSLGDAQDNLGINDAGVIDTGTLGVARLPAANALDSELPTPGVGLCASGVDWTFCAPELPTPTDAIEGTDEIVMTDTGETPEETVVYTVASLSTFQATGDLNLTSVNGTLSLIATFRGAYSNLGIYSHGDVVESGGDYWVSEANNNENSTPSRTNTNWALLTDDAGDVANLLADGTGDGLQSTGSSLQLHVQELDAIGSDYSTEDLFFITNVTGVGTSENRSDTVSDWLDRTAGDGLSRDGTELRVTQGGIVSTMLQSGINLGGNPSTTTQAVGNDSTRIATTAFVHDVHLQSGTITATQLAADSVGSSEIEAGAVQSSEIANDGIDSEDYAPGSVDSTAIGAAAVISAKIANSAVTTAKISNATILGEDLANGTITLNKMGLNSVDAGRILPNAVNSSEIASGAVGNSELATNAVTTSKIANGDINSVDLADNAVTQAKIADDAVGIDQLKIDSGTSMAQTSNQFITVDSYAFGLRVDRTESVCQVNLANASGDSGVWRSSNCGTHTLRWYYFTDSDRPSVWATLDSTGAVAGVYEAGDPISDGDTVAPVSGPVDANGDPLPGYTVVKVGVPSLTVIEAVVATLTPAQQTAALTCTGEYVTGRGWISSLASLGDLSQISARYRPAGRRWAVRCAAEAAVEEVTAFYGNHLVVTGGAWALPME